MSLIGSLARDEGDTDSDADLVWVGGPVARTDVPIYLREISQGHLADIADERLDLTILTPATFLKERRLGTKKAWELESASIVLRRREEFGQKTPISPFPYQIELRRLDFLLKNTTLFGHSTYAADMCDAGFLYGIIRELSIALGGVAPTRSDFAREGILSNAQAFHALKDTYRDFTAAVRASTTGRFDRRLSKELLREILEATRTALDSGLSEPGCAFGGEIPADRDWWARSSYHRKSAIVAELFARTFRNVVPLLGGMRSYNWWLRHPGQTEPLERLDIVASAHTIVWETLGRAVSAPDETWKQFVTEIIGRVSR